METVVKYLSKYGELLTSQRFTVAAVTVVVLLFGVKESDATSIIQAVGSVIVGISLILSYAIRKPGESKDLIRMAEQVNKLYNK